jgi:hypothetical protein
MTHGQHYMLICLALNVKFSLHIPLYKFVPERHAMKTHGGVNEELHAFLVSAALASYASRYPAEGGTAGSRLIA